MALVNALQHNATDSFHPRAANGADRFMKIRSIWPFPVKGPLTGSPTGEFAEAEVVDEEAGDSVTPSSFVT